MIVKVIKYNSRKNEAKVMSLKDGHEFWVETSKPSGESLLFKKGAIGKLQVNESAWGYGYILRSCELPEEYKKFASDSKEEIGWVTLFKRKFCSHAMEVDSFSQKNLGEEDINIVHYKCSNCGVAKSEFILK